MLIVRMEVVNLIGELVGDSFAKQRGDQEILKCGEGRGLIKPTLRVVAIPEDAGVPVERGSGEWFWLRRRVNAWRDRDPALV